MNADIYGTIGEVFDPSKYFNCIEAGSLDNVKLHRPIHKETPVTEREFDYDVNTLIANIRLAIEFNRLEPGDSLEVGYGDFTLTARIVADEVINEPGDGRITAPHYDCSYRLEDVSITDDEENHRRIEETIIRKTIF